MLDVLGLSRNAAVVYEKLVSMPSATVDDLLRAVPADHADVREALVTLERHAMVGRTEVAGEDRWTAVPPLLTGQRLLIEQAQRLVDTQRTLLALAEEHRRAAVTGADDLVDVVFGAQAVHEQVSRLINSATTEVMALVKPPFVALQPDEAEVSPPVARERVVYDQGFFDEDGATMALVRDNASPDDAYRVHPSVPMRLHIYDRRAAIMPVMRHDAQPSLLLVHPSGLLTLAIEFFEAIWERAVPLPLYDREPDAEPAGGRLGVHDRQVLGFLLAGHTDLSAAHQLGRSLRWVQRRVRLMMDAAGVRTRLQLGWEARRRGWLDGTDTVQPPAAPVSRDLGGVSPG